jgi:hypothetical protein
MRSSHFKLGRERYRQSLEHARHLASERDALLSSRSWRMTAPLRSLSLGVRRLIDGPELGQPIEMNAQAGLA